MLAIGTHKVGGNVACDCRLIKYKPNSLEMDYTYEIHEEPNLGLTIDLIDPAKYEGVSRTICSWVYECGTCFLMRRCGVLCCSPGGA
jgi:hypothetical protein